MMMSLAACDPKAAVVAALSFLEYLYLWVRQTQMTTVRVMTRKMQRPTWRFYINEVFPGWEAGFLTKAT